MTQKSIIPGFQALKDRGIVGKLLAVQLPLVAVSMLLVFVLLEFGFYRTQLSNLEDGIDDLLELQADPASIALWEVDDKRLKQIVADIANYPSVEAVVVTDERGKIRASAGNTDVVPESPKLQGIRSLTYEGTPVGELRAVLHTRFIKGLILQHIPMDAAVMVIVLIAMVIGVVLASRRVIQQPLRLLASEMARIRDLGWREPIAWHSNDELGNVVAAFNWLQETQALTQQSLKALNDELEERVEKRTKDLSDTQYALDRVGIAIHWVEGKTGRFIYVNERAAEMVGYPVQEMLKLRVSDIAPNFPAENFEGLADELFASGTTRFETVLSHRDGTLIPVELVGYVFPTQQGQAHRYITFLTDISQRKAQERVLIDARREAESASQAKSVFLANMSHEIRTPLNGILGMVHLLRREGVTEKQAARLDTINTSADHLLSVINDILDLSKIEAGKLTLETTDVVVEAILANVSSIVSPKAQAKGLKFLLATERVPRRLRGDPTRLTQALLNYANNAIKFTPSGSITLHTYPVAEDEGSVLLRFEVVDTGIGISREAQSQLFEVFQQADSSTTRKYGGTGLGLAITKRLAELMGGEAGVSSELGKGSTFWLTARFEKCAQPEATAVALDANEAERLLRETCRGKTILLVEDDPINQMVGVELLSNTGLLVETAEDGVQAVEKVQAKDYDLILMDMQMPNMDGVSATRLIRQTPGKDAIPILAMTANAFNEDRAKCLAAGMNDFLSKPVVPEIFFSLLLRWLSKEKDR